jgi:hypothetical protein
MVLGNLDILLCAFNDPLAHVIVQKVQELVNYTEPDSGLRRAPQVLGCILNQGLL